MLWLLVAWVWHHIGIIFSIIGVLALVLLVIVVLSNKNDITEKMNSDGSDGDKLVGNSADESTNNQ